MFATGFWSFLGKSHYHGKRDTSKTNCSYLILPSIVCCPCIDHVSGAATGGTPGRRSAWLGNYDKQRSFLLVGLDGR